jgi:hypothetical protein
MEINEHACMHYAWIKRSRQVKSKGRVPLFLVFEQNLNPFAASGALKIIKKWIKIENVTTSQSRGV